MVPPPVVPPPVVPPPVVLPPVVLPPVVLPPVVLPPVVLPPVVLPPVVPPPATHSTTALESTTPSTITMFTLTPSVQLLSRFASAGAAVKAIASAPAAHPTYILSIIILQAAPGRGSRPGATAGEGRVSGLVNGVAAGSARALEMKRFAMVTNRSMAPY